MYNALVARQLILYWKVAPLSYILSHCSRVYLICFTSIAQLWSRGNGNEKRIHLLF